MFNTLSDPYLTAAFRIGVGALALSLLMAGQIVYLRAALRRHQRRQKASIEKWRPLLNAALAQAAPESLPPLGRKEHFAFLQFWVHLQGSVRGEARDALNDIAYRLQCDAIARRLLHRRDRGEQLLGIMTLGHLRSRDAWSVLLDHASRPDSTTSLYALWALVQTDAAAAAARMAVPVIRRADWPLSQIVNILKDARDAWAPALIDALAGLDDERLPRALRIAHALRIDIPAPLLSGLLLHDSVDVLAAALDSAATPAMLPAVRAHQMNADWQVRVHVAKALGRIGDRSDIDRLRVLLSDSQWWVRYRAAQSLVDLPFLGKAEFDELCLNISDPFAGDMLKQVLAEREMQ